MSREYTVNEIRCPHCGDAQCDPWDLYDDSGGQECFECECQECKKAFGFSVKTEVWFTSYPLKTKTSQKLTKSAVS